MSLPPIPVACKDIIRCGCKTGSSSGRCSCRAGKLKCTGACACANNGNDFWSFGVGRYVYISCKDTFYIGVDYRHRKSEILNIAYHKFIFPLLYTLLTEKADFLVSLI
ncbi:hypothetical protein GQR58_012249 [Nymphon striatum]|nr:hypothetical protein GQR58_012249 [Nymphon striatum]